jgi:hypothetical protein
MRSPIVMRWTKSTSRAGEPNLEVHGGHDCEVYDLPMLPITLLLLMLFCPLVATIRTTREHKDSAQRVSNQTDFGQSLLETLPGTSVDPCKRARSSADSRST